MSVSRERGQETCPTCGKVTWLVTHSCPGLMPDTTPVDLDAIQARLTAMHDWRTDRGATTSRLLSGDFPAVIAELRDLRAALVELAPARGAMGPDKVAVDREALPPPEQLLLLAGWFDQYDDRNGVPPGSHPGRQVQTDLRKWAYALAAALSEPQPKPEGTS